MPNLKQHKNLMKSVSKSIIYDEGSIKNKFGRHVVYKCSANKNTIGYGRNLDDLGLSEEEALILLNNDLERVFFECLDIIWNFMSLNRRRKVALMNMCFQLGSKKFKLFRKMRAAIKIEDFEKASKEMLDSLWARETPKRAKRLARMML